MDSIFYFILGGVIGIALFIYFIKLISKLTNFILYGTTKPDRSKQ